MAEALFTGNSGNAGACLSVFPLGTRFLYVAQAFLVVIIGYMVALECVDLARWNYISQNLCSFTFLVRKDHRVQWVIWRAQ